MSINTGSKHYDAYYDHVLNKQKSTGAIAKVYDIIYDISDRGGLGNEWEQIDGEIQDEIIDKWVKIIDRAESASESPDYKLTFCEKCFQMTNHLNGVCQKCDNNSVK
jgi:hypothetical protein